MRIIGEKIYLKILSPEDISPNYVEWMDDPEVIRFLESRWKSYTFDELKDYVRQMNNSPNDVMFGIFAKESNIHVGNIKVGNISQIHRFAEIGLIVGDKSVWGQGYGTEAIALASKYAFEELNLNKLIAGIYANNTGSYKAFLKSGYREVGILKNHRFDKGHFVDEFLMEKCKF